MKEKKNLTDSVISETMALQNTLALSKYGLTKDHREQKRNIHKNLIPSQEFSAGWSTEQPETSGGPASSWQWARKLAKGSL